MRYSSSEERKNLLLNFPKTSLISFRVLNFVLATLGTFCYYANPNGESSGAQPVNGVNDEASCTNLCTQTPSCASYQIDTNPGHAYCWSQADQSALTNPDNQYNQENVVEYIKSSCVCYRENPNGLSSGANPVDGVSDQTSCENHCNLSPSCVSYQINTNPGQEFCWCQADQNALTDPNNQYYQANVVEYIKSSCGSNSGAVCYYANPNGESFGADRVDGVNDQTSCANACTGNPSCVSYQIDTEPGQPYCWCQTDQNELTDPNNQYNQQNVVEYVKTNCSAVCYSVNQDGQSIGANPVNGVNDETSCQVKCTQSPSCASYQINTNPGEPYCWAQTSQSALTDRNNQYNQGNVVEYIKSTCNTTTVSSP